MPPKPGLKPLLVRLKTEVDRRLDGALARQEDTARTLGPEAVAMVAALRSLSMRGGKRLRPLFLHLGGLCHDPEFLLRQSAEAGVALELLQAYFLIHDDWMDQDAERRGGPTAHVQLERSLGSVHLGERAAILAGDLAVAMAQKCLASLRVEPERLVRALSFFALMQESAVLGQQLDVVAQHPDAELIYVLKTASYTVQGPLEMGLALAGGGRAAELALARYARPAGVAFQLRDDLLGLFGEPARTGKPRGADLLAGKKTSFFLLADQLLPRRERAAMRALHGARRASKKQLEAVLSMLERSEPRQVVEARIQELKAEALRALRSKSLSGRGSSLLRDATEALIERDA